MPLSHWLDRAWPLWVVSSSPTSCALNRVSSKKKVKFCQISVGVMTHRRTGRQREPEPQSTWDQHRYLVKTMSSVAGGNENTMTSVAGGNVSAEDHLAQSTGRECLEPLEYRWHPSCIVECGVSLRCGLMDRGGGHTNKKLLKVPVKLPLIPKF